MVAEIDTNSGIVNIQMRPGMSSTMIYRIVTAILKNNGEDLQEAIFAFSEIREADSVLLGTLIALEIEMRKMSGKLHIVNASPWIIHNFEQVGLARIFSLSEKD